MFPSGEKTRCIHTHNIPSVDILELALIFYDTNQVVDQILAVYQVVFALLLDTVSTKNHFESSPSTRRLTWPHHSRSRSQRTRSCKEKAISAAYEKYNKDHFIIP
jgi:hypothetical protein